MVRIVAGRWTWARVLGCCCRPRPELPWTRRGLDHLGPSQVHSCTPDEGRGHRAPRRLRRTLLFAASQTTAVKDIACRQHSSNETPIRDG